MDTREGLIRLGLYGTRFVLAVGDTELFMVKRVDLNRHFIRLQRWPIEYLVSCDFKAMDKSYFHPEDFGVIARNGYMAKIRGTMTREQLVERLQDTLGSGGILTEGFGRPIYMTGVGARILSGDQYLPREIHIKRNHPLPLETVHLSKYGYILHPTLPALIRLLDRHAGVLCDPFAIQQDTKKTDTKFVHLPTI